MRNEFTAIIHPPENPGDWFIAFCPEIPETNGQGRSVEEALEHLRKGKCTGS